MATPPVPGTLVTRLTEALGAESVKISPEDLRVYGFDASYEGEAPWVAVFPTDARAVSAIRALYPQLEARRFAGVTGFFPPGEKQSVVDVTYPHRPDNAETLRTAVWVAERNQKYRVPALEAALANKYGAMLTPTRDSIKLVDG